MSVTDLPLTLGNHVPVILFDGVCNLCNGSVNFIIDRDPDAQFKFASLQSEAARPYIRRCFTGKTTQVELPDERDLLQSIILIENGTCYDRSTAVLRIAKKLKGAWSLLYGIILIPKPIRDWAYTWVARNRYKWFGRDEVCRLPSPGLNSRFLDNLQRSTY